ncbi:serine hydrolase domain-containing protein [Arthrobacter sp. C152]
MTLSNLAGALKGTADCKLESIADRFAGYLEVDPTLSFQMAAFCGGDLVLDVWGGPDLDGQSLSVPYSVSKNIIGVVVGLLVERQALDLDAPVAQYWPEFGQGGKKKITVRQLLSHQAGLPDLWPRLSWDELLDHHRAADRLAAAVPVWLPGSAFGYHALTIGNLAMELVYRVSGDTLHDYYEREIRRSLDADFYLGLPDGMEHRLKPVKPMVPPLAQHPSPTPHPMRSWLSGPRPGGDLDLANDSRSQRFGHPAASATGSARGIASLLAGTITGLDGSAPLLGSNTIAAIGQQQVRGYDEVLNQTDRAHSIIFQKPNLKLAWGGPRSFGHDGAMGAVACVDPDTGVAFAYTISRGPWPGGGDPRAISAAHDIGAALS